MKKVALVVLAIALSVCLVACNKDKNKEVETVPSYTVATKEADYSMKLEETSKVNEEAEDNKVQHEIVWDGTKGYKEEAVETEVQNIEKMMETLEDGDSIEKARVNQASIEASEAEFREQSGETLGESQALESQIVTDEMHEEFQKDIDEYTQREYDEWKAQQGGQ